MLLQPDNDGFSVPVVFRSKARCEDKGVAFAGEARLAANADQATELAMIRLKKH